MSERPFTGKKALETGGSRGIRRAVCIALAQQGADIAFIYHPDEDAGAETRRLVGMHAQPSLPLQPGLANSSARILRQIPLRGLGTPEEIARRVFPRRTRWCLHHGNDAASRWSADYRCVKLEQDPGAPWIFKRD